MWDNAPGSSMKRQPPASPPMLHDDELSDITLEKDLQEIEEDIPDAQECQRDAITLPGPEILPTQPRCPEDENKKSAYYIEEFPANLGAGAVWGEEIPVFEKLWQEQKKSGSSQWGPFEDEDEWELAEWLIRNIGQKQTDSFLNLKIVRSHRLIKYGSLTNRMNI
jgi:hypothetical protein